jgi:hypothetical protein
MGRGTGQAAQFARSSDVTRVRHHSDAFASRGPPGQASSARAGFGASDADRALWTRTIWRDETTMRSFMQSVVHRVMARLPEWRDEATRARVHYSAPAPADREWEAVPQRDELLTPERPTDTLRKHG